MKRRTFVRNAALGTLTLGLNSGFLPLPSSSGSVRQWVDQLALYCGARRRSAPAQGVDSFLQLTAGLNDYFAARGFLPAGASYYFYKERAACFYPLHLRHATDLLLAVLHRQPDGSWRHTATLTGFEVEALVRAGTALDERTEPLHELLLPAGSPADGRRFHTQRGTVAVSTLLSDGASTSTVTVRLGSEVVFHDVFQSRHCLTCTAGTV